MKDRTRKTLYIAVIAALAAFAVTLYVIELLTSEPVFGVTSFSLNYVLSLPFLLLSLIIDIGMAVLMNRPAMRKRSVGLRLLGEGVLAVTVSGILVAAVNLPFISDMGGYVRSVQFWKSVYAAALINIFILAAAEFVIQTSINRHLQKENAVLKYRQLKSQINPHFLFNSLNVLVSLINKDSGLAVKYTKKLSAVYRYVLTRDEKDTVTVGEEVEFIGNYISILKTRFDTGLEFRFDIRPEDLSRSVPPMSLQMLVENAVKHNAVSPENPLTINIFSDGNSLCVSNGISPRLSRSEGTGVGLKNLSNKYAILAGRDISVSDDGNVFSVKLPLL